MIPIIKYIKDNVVQPDEIVGWKEIFISSLEDFFIEYYVKSKNLFVYIPYNQEVEKTSPKEMLEELITVEEGNIANEGDGHLLKKTVAEYILKEMDEDTIDEFLRAIMHFTTNEGEY